MAIISTQFDQRLWPGYPKVVYIQTTDTVSNVLSAGYLNAFAMDVSSADMALVTTVNPVNPSLLQSDWYNILIVGSNTNLVELGGSEWVHLKLWWVR